MNWIIAYYKKISIKRKRVIVLVFILWGLWFFGVGALLSSLLSKGQLAKFPELTKADKVLIIAPHIDDEVIAAAGIIQAGLKVGAQVKVVYMTNGDNNLSSVIKENKNLKLAPNEFIALGEQRMTEAKNATQILGLKADNLIFLGYPDQGLLPMLNKFYDSSKPYASKGTEFTYNPYSNTYKNGQIYAGANVVDDLYEIINLFKPTYIFVSHPRDSHPDHHATYLFLEKALTEETIKSEVFAYLVHSPYYPSPRRLTTNQFLYPPKKLYSQEGWYSFNLSTEQINAKLAAVRQNVSQKELGRVYDFLQSFVKKNEIFEKMN